MQSALTKVDGVNEAKVSLSDENAIVVYHPEKTSIKKMKTVVKNAGYEVTDNTDPKPAKEQKTAES